jgi:glutamine amidotransferase
MATVAVVDYGMGNLRSVSQAVMHVAAGTGLR